MNMECELQKLLNEQRVGRVAASDGHRFVSNEHYRRWSFAPISDKEQEASKTEDAKEDKQLLPSIRIWRLPNGKLNSDFLSTMRCKVLGIIMASPSIYEVWLPNCKTYN